MTKKKQNQPKAKEVMTEEEVKANKEILDDLNKIEELFVDAEPKEVKAPKKKKTTKKEAKEPKAPKPEVKADPDVIEGILNELPEIVKTKDLNQVFAFNDGGKYMRRHLRSKFSEGHEHGEAWVWKKEDKQLLDILEYFASTLTEEKKAQLTVVGEDAINGGK